MQAKTMSGVLLTLLLSSASQLLAAPPHDQSELPQSAAQANAPEDSSPTPEDILLTAGVWLTIPAMSAVLGDASRSAELRYWAAIALGRTGDPAVLPALTANLGAAEADIRYGVVLGLGELGSGADVLAPALADPEAGIRAAAVQALGRIGDPEAQRLLIQKLRDPDERHNEIRMNAALELGRLRTRLARPALLAALEDGAVEVRTAAALGLARAGNRVAVRTLVEATLDPYTEEWLRVDAVQALETLSGESFQYVKPYSAPTTKKERAAALSSVERWWAQRDSLYP